MGLLLAGRVVAQDAQLATAQRAYDEASFDEAESALNEAEQLPNLTSSQLERLLKLRVLIAFARRDAPAIEEGLEQLAVVAPDAPLEDVAPDLRRQWLALRVRVARPELTCRLEAEVGSARVHAEVRGDQGLLRRLEVHARAGGDWRSGERELLVPSVAGNEVAYYAVALGPGGVPIARCHSREDPARERVGQPVAGRLADPVGAPAAVADESWVPWVIVGSAIAVAAAVAIVVAVLLGGRTPTAVNLTGPGGEG